jgi:hypothetical protein
MKQETTRTVSDKQEKRLSKLLGGRCQPNSGGTRTGGGDVHTKDFLIEAKTAMKPQKNFTIQKEWLDKAEEQAFEQNKPYSALAFSFDPEGPDYFVVDKRLFTVLADYLEGRI